MHVFRSDSSRRGNRTSLYLSIFIDGIAILDCGHGMEWWKVISKSLRSAIGLTTVFPVVQIALGYVGIEWLAPLPPPLLGKSYWGVPWGLVSRVVYPSAPYTIEWDYLVYDMVFWFIIAFIYHSIRLRKRS